MAMSTGKRSLRLESARPTERTSAPTRYSMAMKYPSVPSTTSWVWTMFGCCRVAATRASSRNMRTKARSFARSGRMRLITTCLRTPEVAAISPT